jgi:hypothetical protein
MPTYLFRLSCRSRRLLLALLLAFSGSLFAQGLSVAPLPQPSSLEPEQTAVNGFHRAPAEGTRERHDFRQRPGPVGEPWFHGGGGVCPCGRTAEGVRAASFWDRENRALFTAVGALAAADFCATRANLTSGGRELNPVTRVFSGSTPGLATN